MSNETSYWRPEPQLWDWAFWSLLAPAAVWVSGVIIYGAQALMAADLKWQGQDIGSALMVVGGESGTLFTVMEVYRKSKSDDANAWDWSGIAVSLLSTLGVLLVIFTRQTALNAEWIDPVRNWGPLVLLLCSALDFYANVIELGYYRASFAERWQSWNDARHNWEQSRRTRAESARAVTLRNATRADWRRIYADMNGNRGDITADRVNAILTEHGYREKPTSTARDWANEARG